MSYLGLPRIHFAGAFFANPSNLNNYTGNYDFAADDKDLIYETGPYNNPEGVAQFYFRETVITQCVGSDGQIITDEPLVGSGINTVNTWEGQTDANGNNYILAKMVDLDPDMQFRTELYGLRLFVKTADGYGFSGSIDVPQLRDLYFFRGAGSNNDDEKTLGYRKMQVACGTWHQRLSIDQWFIPQAGKRSVLDLLSAGGAAELDIKLSVDMFVCDPNNQFTTGDMYCYGRLMGTIGAVQANMPRQIVPGRRMYSPISFDGLNSTASDAKMAFTREAGAKAAEQAKTQLAPWNNTDARVVTAAGKHYLLVDMGTATPLASDSPLGIFDFSKGLELGYLDGKDNFTPFTRQGCTQGGKFIRVPDQLTDYIELDGANAYRKSVYLKNAGVAQLELSDDEAGKLTSARLAIQTEHQLVLKENTGGYYVNFETASCRLSPESGTNNVNLTAFQYGLPMSAINRGSGLNVDFANLVVQYDNEALEFKNYSPRNSPTKIISTSVDSQMISQQPGQFVMTINTGEAQPFQPKPTNKDEYNNWVRKPLDSQLCYIKATATNVLIGENPNLPPGLPYVPAVAVLFWQNQWLSDSPGWDDNIGPIFKVYAKLYPGMAGLIDIADEKTVISYASALFARFNLEVEDPAFMPVVRDMSPATIEMMKIWLKKQISKGKTGAFA